MINIIKYLEYLYEIQNRKYKIFLFQQMDYILMAMSFLEAEVK